MPATTICKNLVKNDDGSFTIKNVHLSYPHLFEPWRKSEKERLRYSAVGLLDVDVHKEALAHLQAELVGLQKSAFKKKLKADLLCLRDGALSGKDEYEGKWSLTAGEREDHPPILVNKFNKTVKKSEDVLFAGAVVNIRFRLWTQDNEHGQRINANLIGVQAVSDDGTRFSTVERIDPAEAFEAEEGGDDGDDGFGD